MGFILELFHPYKWTYFGLLLFKQLMGWAHFVPWLWPKTSLQSLKKSQGYHSNRHTLRAFWTHSCHRNPAGSQFPALRLESQKITAVSAGFGATFFHLFLDGPMFVLGDGLVDPSSFSSPNDSRVECQVFPALFFINEKRAMLKKVPVAYPMWQLFWNFGLVGW